MIYKNTLTNFKVLFSLDFKGFKLIVLKKQHKQYKLLLFTEQFKPPKNNSCFFRYHVHNDWIPAEIGAPAHPQSHENGPEGHLAPWPCMIRGLDEFLTAQAGSQRV